MVVIEDGIDVRTLAFFSLLVIEQQRVISARFAAHITNIVPDLAKF